MYKEHLQGRSIMIDKDVLALFAGPRPMLEARCATVLLQKLERTKQPVHLLRAQ